GRPGSNRPPRPWQGRALPNELLPHEITDYADLLLRISDFGFSVILFKWCNPRYKELKGSKNNKWKPLKKILTLICTWVYTVYFPEQKLPACLYTFLYKACNYLLLPSL